MKCPHCNGTGALEPNEANVGTMIMSVRKSRDMTQKQLSEKCGLSRAQIANIEVGRSDIPTKTLAKFAQALNCSMRDLIPEETP